jgi:hypothetical protein
MADNEVDVRQLRKPDNRRRPQTGLAICCNLKSRPEQHHRRIAFNALFAVINEL